LYNQQLQLSDILESATDYKDAQLRLEKSDMKNTAWEVEKWDIGMLETAIAIAQKWKNGF
jgi:hypothetical protein